MLNENKKSQPGESPNLTLWSSKFGFLMAAIGSAVGLGNIWRFPYLAGQNGGGIFVLVYVLATLLVALPVLIAELMLGRAGRAGPVAAMRALIVQNGSSRVWTGIIGWGAMVAAVLLLSYYSVIGGWTLKYTFSAILGLFTHIDQSHSAHLFQEMVNNPWVLMAYHGLFILLSMLIVVGGVEKGIEKSAVIMMPLLFLVLAILVIYAATTPGFARGWHFLFDFNVKNFSMRAFLAAIGQAFFALSVGIGAMMTYGSYLTKSADVMAVSLKIALADTLVAILAGLAIFPIVFTYALAPTEGPGLTFVTLPIAFGQMTGGIFFGTAFFVLLVLAALTSSISVLETFVAFLAHHFNMGRFVATVVSGFVVWLLGLLTVFSFNILSSFHPLEFLGITGTFFNIIDFLVSNVFLLGVGLGIAVYAGWALTQQVVAGYLDVHERSIRFVLWRVCVRVIAPIGIVVAFVFECFLS